jgi:coproporphyrinogen III oxidase
MEEKTMNMEEFHGEVEEVALEGFKRLNATNQVEHKKWDVPVGSWEVSTVRGKVLEKATLARIQLKTKNPFTDEDMQLDVVQAKVYPASPRIPILLFNVENRVTKVDKFAGMLDVVPVAASEEDLHFLGAEIKEVTERYGENFEALNKKVQNIYKMDGWENAVNAGIGIYLDLALEQFDLVRTAGLHWLKSYFTIVEKRAQESYGREDVALMDSVRARILEYYLLDDMSITASLKLGVPLEAMTLGILAPTIRY